MFFALFIHSKIWYLLHQNSSCFCFQLKFQFNSAQSSIFFVLSIQISIRFSSSARNSAIFSSSIQFQFNFNFHWKISAKSSVLGKEILYHLTLIWAGLEDILFPSWNFGALKNPQNFTPWGGNVKYPQIPRPFVSVFTVLNFFFINCAVASQFYFPAHVGPPHEAVSWFPAKFRSPYPRQRSDGYKDFFEISFKIFLFIQLHFNRSGPSKT